MPSVLFVIAAAVACYALVKLASFVRSYLAEYREYLKIEGEPHSLLWGHLRDHQLSVPLGESSIDFILRSCRHFEWRPFRVMLGPFKRCVAFSHPEDVQTILKTSEPKAEVIYSILRPWLGNGLLIASGRLWFRNRRLLTPAFHFDVLKPYAAIFSSCVNTALKVLSSSSGRPVEVFGFASRLTLDTLLQCALSLQSNCQIDRGIQYVEAVLRISTLIIERSLSIPHQSDMIYAFSANGKEFRQLCKFVHEFAEDIIKKRRKALEQTKTNGALSNQQRDLRGKCRDFIDILLEGRDSNGVGLSDLEIRNEVDTFMFEGHDTTASGITWTLYCLAKHPEHQQRIRNEVKQILGNGKTEFEWESLNSLTYTTQCIKESMRLFPPVPTIHRELTEDMNVRQYTLRKGQWIYINILGLHRNPAFWKDPDEFKPERMETQAVKDRHSYAYVPFSAGPRNCIGQQFALNEERISIARIVSSYQLELTKDFKVERVMNVILKPLGGLPLRFGPIN